MIDAFVLLQFREDKDDHTYGGKLEPVGVTFNPQEAKKFPRGWGSKRQVLVFTLKPEEGVPVGDTKIKIEDHKTYKTFVCFRQEDGDSIENATNLFTLLESSMGLELKNKEWLRIQVYRSTPGVAKLTPLQQAFKFVEMISNMSRTGEMVDGKTYVQDEADAVNALDRLIKEARAVTEQT